MTFTETTLTDDNTDTDRVAIVRHDPKAGAYPIIVFFGRMDGATFVPSYSKSSKSYKTPKGAARAADIWRYAGR